MSTPKRATPSQATLSKVLEKLIERDEAHHIAWAQVTSKQADHGRLLEAVLVEQQRMGRVLEAQGGYNERQIKLAEQTQTHGETFARVFNDIRELRQDHVNALRALEQAFTTYQREHSAVHDKDQAERSGMATAVNKFKGGIIIGASVLGVIVVLVGVIATTWRTDIQQDISANKQQLDLQQRDLQTLRIESVRSGQRQE